MASIEYTTGKPVIHKHKGSDITDLSNYIGQPLGVFTTNYPTSPNVGRYDFAGTDGATIGGVTYHNGDSAFWDGSAWTRIPAQVMDDELNKLVSKTGDQTIAGVKTFSSSPVIPSATNNTEAQNKAGVETQITARQENIRSQSTTKSPTSKLMDDLLKANPTFKGVATPSTNPGIPDGSLFYLAVEKGVYSNFGGQSVSDSDGLVVLLYSSVWEKHNIPIATKTELDQLAGEVNGITELAVTLDTTKLSSEKALNSSGVLYSKGFCYANPTFIRVIPSSKIHKKLRAFVGDLEIAFYSDNNEGSFISGIVGTNALKEEVVDVPSNANYFRYSTIGGVSTGAYLICNHSANEKTLQLQITENTTDIDNLAKDNQIQKAIEILNK